VLCACVPTYVCMFTFGIFIYIVDVVAKYLSNAFTEHSFRSL